ncbi:MAG: hypothetical protein AMXMBFR59_06580 [Rhodanobacteraceae bacterium]
MDADVRCMQCGRMHERVGLTYRVPHELWIGDVADKVDRRCGYCVEAKDVVIAAKARVDGPPNAACSAGDEHSHRLVGV